MGPERRWRPDIQSWWWGRHGQPIFYLPAMFAACMLFQTLYVLCVALWLVFPDLKGHALLAEIFPRFEFLSVLSFIYGLIVSALYGWFAAASFVFFYNAWSTVSRAVWGKRVAASPSGNCCS